MNLTAYHPFSSFDQLAIGVALLVVMGIIGFRILTGRPWRRTLPPDEIDGESFSSTSTTRPLSTPPLLNKDDTHDTR